MAGLITAPFSIGGLPAIVLPCGFTTDGLPLSLQIGGRPFDEPTVLRAAHAYEQVTDWHRRHPNLESLTDPKPLPDKPQDSPLVPVGLPRFSRKEIRQIAGRAGLALSEQHLTELTETFPHYAAIAARLPRERSRADELAHLFNPARIFESMYG
jgi:hypothetical protein